MTALRSAPSAAEAIGVELEKVAGERKALERELRAIEAAQGPQADMIVDQETVKAFCRTMKPNSKPWRRRSGGSCSRCWDSRLPCLTMAQ